MTFLKSGFIRPVDYPTWLANPVLVRIPDGSWRMCVDYTSLYKACPKDEYPMPRIDQIVDSTSACELLCFLDAYSGYQQINISIEDEEATLFITPFGIFCYVKMPFGLKNAGGTYQKCVHIVFEHQIRRNVEPCIDDIVVKLRRHGDLPSDLQEMFNNLRKYKMKLNLRKCIFSVSVGKLLGYTVSSRGIDANPKKIEAIDRLQLPRNHKDIQKLADMMVALSRFISKSGERGMPFYKMLRKIDDF